MSAQFYKCPNCGRIYNDNKTYYCLNCRYPLKREEEVDKVKHPELNEHKIIGIIKKEHKNVPKCPTCQSTNIKKVSGTYKAVSVAMFGLLSQKVKKQFHCNNCGYEW